MFVILFYAKLTPYLGEGPRWYTSQVPTPCETYWWTNLLYINNFYPDTLMQEVNTAFLSLCIGSHSPASFLPVIRYPLDRILLGESLVKS